MKHRIKYIAARVLVGVTIALILTVCRQAFAETAQSFQLSTDQAPLGKTTATFSSYAGANQAAIDACKVHFPEAQNPFYYMRNGSGAPFAFDIPPSGVTVTNNCSNGAFNERRAGNLSITGLSESVCPAAGTKKSFARPITGDYDLFTYVSNDGCEYTYSADQPEPKLCTYTQYFDENEPNGVYTSPGPTSCIYSYQATGEQGQGSAPPPPVNDTQIDSNMTERQPDSSTEEVDPPIQETLPDGSTKKVEDSHNKTIDGAVYNFTRTENGVVVTRVDTGVTNVDETTTTTTHPSGAYSQVTRTTTSYKTGDRNVTTVENTAVKTINYRGSEGKTDQTITKTCSPTGVCSQTKRTETSSGDDGLSPDGGNGDGEGGDAACAPTDRECWGDPDIDVATDTIPSDSFELGEVSEAGQSIASGCPPDRKISILQTEITIPMQPFCDLASTIRYFVTAGAWLIAALLVGRGIGGN